MYSIYVNNLMTPIVEVYERELIKAKEQARSVYFSIYTSDNDRIYVMDDSEGSCYQLDHETLELVMIG